jgi:hypothetical protein
VPLERLSKFAETTPTSFENEKYNSTLKYRKDESHNTSKFNHCTNNP